MSHSAPPQPDRPARAHEERDIGVRAIFLAGLGLAVLVVVAGVGLWFLFNALQSDKEQTQGEVSPLVSVEPPPPDPQLQGTPAHPNVGPSDLTEMRRHEDQVLTSYGVNPQTMAPHIPIDEAMKLLAERGLRGAGTRPATQGGGK